MSSSKGQEGSAGEGKMAAETAKAAEAKPVTPGAPDTAKDVDRPREVDRAKEAAKAAREAERAKLIREKEADAMARLATTFKTRGGKGGIPDGWRVEVKQRESGQSRGDFGEPWGPASSHAKLDYLYFGPDNTKYRSAKQAVEALIAEQEGGDSDDGSPSPTPSASGPGTDTDGGQAQEQQQRSAAATARANALRAHAASRQAAAAAKAAAGGGGAAAAVAPLAETVNRLMNGAPPPPRATASTPPPPLPTPGAAHAPVRPPAAGAPGSAAYVAPERRASTAAQAAKPPLPHGERPSAPAGEGAKRKADPKATAAVDAMRAAKKRRTTPATLLHSGGGPTISENASYSLGSHVSQLIRELDDDADSAEVGDYGTVMLAWRLTRAAQRHHAAEVAAAKAKPSGAGTDGGDRVVVAGEGLEVLADVARAFSGPADLPEAEEPLSIGASPKPGPAPGSGLSDAPVQGTLAAAGPEPAAAAACLSPPVSDAITPLPAAAAEKIALKGGTTLTTGKTLEDGSMTPGKAATPPAPPADQPGGVEDAVKGATIAGDAGTRHALPNGRLPDATDASRPAGASAQDEGAERSPPEGTMEWEATGAEPAPGNAAPPRPAPASDAADGPESGSGGGTDPVAGAAGGAGGGAGAPRSTARKGKKYGDATGGVSSRELASLKIESEERGIFDAFKWDDGQPGRRLTRAAVAPAAPTKPCGAGPSAKPGATPVQRSGSAPVPGALGQGWKAGSGPKGPSGGNEADGEWSGDDARPPAHVSPDGNAELPMDDEGAALLLAEGLAVAANRRRMRAHQVAHRRACHLLAGADAALRDMCKLVAGLRAAGVGGQVLNDFPKVARRVRGAARLLASVPQLAALPPATPLRQQGK